MEKRGARPQARVSVWAALKRPGWVCECVSVCWNWALGSGMRPSYPLYSLPLTLRDLSLTHTHTHTHTHLPHWVAGQSPHSWLEEGMTRVSHRDLIKRNHKGWRLLMQSGETLYLGSLSLSSSLSNALNQCSPAQDTLKHWILDGCVCVRFNSLWSIPASYAFCWPELYVSTDFSLQPFSCHTCSSNTEKTQTFKLKNYLKIVCSLQNRCYTWLEGH